MIHVVVYRLPYVHPPWFVRNAKVCVISILEPVSQSLQCFVTEKIEELQSATSAVYNKLSLVHALHCISLELYSTDHMYIVVLV